MEATIKTAVDAVASEVRATGKGFALTVKAIQTAGLEAVNTAFKELSEYSRASDAVKKGAKAPEVSRAKVRETGQNYVRVIKKAIESGLSFDELQALGLSALKVRLAPTKADAAKNGGANAPEEQVLDASPLQEALAGRLSNPMIDALASIMGLADKLASPEVRGLLAMALDLEKGASDDIPPAMLQIAREYIGE